MPRSLQTFRTRIRYSKRRVLRAHALARRNRIYDHVLGLELIQGVQGKEQVLLHSHRFRQVGPGYQPSVLDQRPQGPGLGSACC